MPTNNNIQKTETPKPSSLIADPTAEPISYIEVLKEMGMGGEQVPAKNLVDSTFDIYRARRFDSSFKDGEHAYFCTIKPLDSAEPYTVVLGGGACVEVLDAFISADLGRPLRVTLRYAEGQGKYSGYYFFE